MVLILLAENRQATGWHRRVSGRLKKVYFIHQFVIGFQNFFTTLESGGASHFNSTYIVATKNLHLDGFIKQIGFTAGYGSDFLNRQIISLLAFLVGLG
jgi:hypothetical protein